MLEGREEMKKSYMLCKILILTGTPKHNTKKGGYLVFWVLYKGMTINITIRTKKKKNPSLSKYQKRERERNRDYRETICMKTKGHCTQANTFLKWDVTTIRDLLK